MSFEDVSTKGVEGSFYRVRRRLKVTWHESFNNNLQSKPCEILVFISHESIINIIYLYYVSTTTDCKKMVKIFAFLNLFQVQFGEKLVVP